jgi:hypothetical protein
LLFYFFLLFTAGLAVVVDILFIILFFYLQLFLPLLAGLAAVQSTAVKAPNVKRGHLEVYMQT